MSATEECTCAMTEASMRTCPVHGEDPWRTTPDDGLLPGDVILPGAFKNQVGKTVPVLSEDKTTQLGTATVTHEDGNLSVRMGHPVGHYG